MTIDRLVDEVHAEVLAVDTQLLEANPRDRRDLATGLVRSRAPLLAHHEVSLVVDRVLARVCGLGLLDDLLADPEVTDVLVNGPGPVWVERRGSIERTPVVLSTDEIELVIERVVGPLGLRIDRSSPLVDARLPDGSRVNAVVPPLAVDGPCLAIRRFGVRTQPLDSFAVPEVAELLRSAVAAAMNLLVVGETGAGKTTLLNALAASIPAHERVVTVEDVAELRLAHDHVVRLEARPASADGVGATTIRQLVRNALRMRPDRIVVGEFRGGEAFDLLQAMGTGHDGSLSTCHASSPADGLRRLETMVLLSGVPLPLPAVRDQIRAAVDLVVEVHRRPDGRRTVAQVAEVVAEPGPSLDGPLEVITLASGGERCASPTRRARRRDTLAAASWAAS